jgi:FkbM family methyltransferase
MSKELLDYSGYNEDELDFIKNFIDSDARPMPGFIVDFTGTRTKTTFVYAEARYLDNTLIPIPVPADFHAEAVEWIGALKSVASASGTFTVLELGAGYGAWCVATCVAARQKGIGDIRLYAVEGDPGHFEDLKEHCQNNGIQESISTLIQGAVGVATGVAHWPKADDPANTWGGRPIMRGERDTTGVKTSEYIEVQLLSLADIVQRELSWDLIHMDVQGHEFDLCSSCIDLLDERVRWIVIGTHSRKIEGDIMELMFSHGWHLANEKPAKIRYNREADNLENMTMFDGTQVWQNMRPV